MDILDILLDILLKPPQPFIGLFFIFYYYKPKNETINRKLDNSLTSYNKILFLFHEMQYK